MRGGENMLDKTAKEVEKDLEEKGWKKETRDGKEIHVLPKSAIEKLTKLPKQEWVEEERDGIKVKVLKDVK